jgi:CelD/BcsL family acetyltransferase involved in cellulose biosynthesis
MSALYIRGALAAVLLSMRSYSVVHAWFSAYDPRFASASPGMELWLGVARTFPDLGVRRVDLGKGPERFKRQLMSGAFEVAEGSVESRPWMGMVRRTCHRAFAWAHQTPLRRPLRGPGRFLRRMVESRRFR